MDVIYPPSDDLQPKILYLFSEFQSWFQILPVLTWVCEKERALFGNIVKFKIKI